MRQRFAVGDLSHRVRPQDDLWGWVNEEWAAGDPIPADRSRYGLSDWKRSRVAQQLREVATGVGAGDSDPAGGLLGTLMALLDDGEQRERVGVRPLDASYERIDAAGDARAILAVWGALQREGITGPFTVHPLPREDDPSRWQVSLFQAGTTLPVPPLYAKHGHDFTAYAHRLTRLADWPEGQVDRALDLERAIAASAWAHPEGTRDEDLHNPMTLDALEDLLGGTGSAYLTAVGVPIDSDVTLNVCQPSYVEGLGRLFTTRPVADWRAYLRWRVLQDRAPLLTAALSDEHARFHQCTLGGQPEPAPTWRRNLDAVQAAAPWVLAQAWATRYLTDDARRRTRELTEQLREGMRRQLTDCAWLGLDSTDAAVAKLDAVTMNIGWPDTWPTLPTIEAGQGLVGAVAACAAVEHDRIVGALSGPVDRGAWGPPPFVVNTFYNPFLNQITVEGASLPPAEVLDDAPTLLAQYGSIIGHELGHAFDTRGSTRDQHGRLVSWWSQAERAAFEERARRVEAQADGYRPRGVDDTGVEGAKVGFECVAELIGLQLAWDIWCAQADPAERGRMVDGLTQDQRFFAAKAYGRRSIDRPTTARNRLLGDVHPPFEVFTNLARNLDGFHDTFGTRPGDGMWLDPAHRVRMF